jgi:DNA-binding response OmpR family regulator
LPSGGKLPFNYQVMAGKKILFVDDEPEMCFMVSNIFKHYGLDVMTAETVEVALDMVEGIPLDAIVLDVNLSGEDGLEFMKFLHMNNPDVPIILYTGMQHDDEVIEKALQQGARQYIRKGGPLDELVQAVQSLSK